MAAREVSRFARNSRDWQQLVEMCRVVDTLLVRQALLWFLEHKLDLPARTAGGEVVWRRPRYSSLGQLIASPTYGGAYAYGKTGVSVHYDGSGGQGPLPAQGDRGMAGVEARHA